MPVVADSYMGMFMPPDIAGRIEQFMASKADFPFIKRDEIVATFYLFGKDHGVAGEQEIRVATDLAKRAVEQAARDIRFYTMTPQRMDPGFTRENYTKRSLQIAVDSRSNGGSISGSVGGSGNAGQAELKRRVAGDPAILADCFAQHVAHYRQGFFFELFQPFRKHQLPSALQAGLEGRMLLLGFNVKDRQSLPFKSSLDPFFRWMALAAPSSGSPSKQAG